MSVEPDNNVSPRTKRIGLYVLLGIVVFVPVAYGLSQLAW